MSTEFSANSNDDNAPNNNPQAECSGADTFDCNICLDTAKDAVITLCGHLFCWPCLVQWFDTRPQNQTCPVCKSGVDPDKVVPLYGRGGSNVDPRTKIPPRPKGTRSQPNSGFGGFTFGDLNMGDGANISFGIGAFPFALFFNIFNFHLGPNRNANQENEGGQAQGDDQFLSNIFFYLGLFFILWIIFV